MVKQVVVIGAGVGGLSAAIHCRLKGHDVLVLEAQSGPGGKAAGVDVGGYRLDPGPSIVILIRLYEALFARAGVEIGEFIQFDRLDPMCRVFFEGSEPIDLSANREECLRRIEDHHPGDGLALRRLMKTLDKVAPHIDRSIFSHPFDRPLMMLDWHLMSIALRFNVRATYKQLVDQRFASPLLRAFFYGFPSYGGQTYDSKAPGAFMVPYLMMEEGVYYPRGGVAAIPRALHALAVRLGVEFRFGERVTGFRSENRRIAAAQVQSGEQVAAEAFVSNVDRLTTRAWLGHSVDWSPSFSYFTVSWGVRKKLPGLQHHTLLVPKAFEKGFEELYRNRGIPSDPIVYVNCPTATDEAAAPAGRENVFAVVTSPAEEPTIDWEAQRESLTQKIRNSLARFGQGFEAGEIEFERVQTPATFRQAHGNYRGSLYGPDEKHRLFGLFPLRNYDEEFDNLFYCGASVQPGAGLPMVTLSGQFVAELI